MSVEGCEVTIHSSSFQTPSACVRCGGPKQYEIETSHYNSGSRTRRSVNLPYCGDCSARRTSVVSARRKITLIAIGVGLASAGVGALLPFLPFNLLVAMPIGIAILAGIALRVRAGASVAMPNAGWMTGFSSNSTSFFFANPQWGQAFAVANGASVRPRKRSDSFWLTPAVLAAVFAGPLAAYVAYATNPPVYVDNESGKDEQIWVDGKPSLVAKAMTGNGLRPSVRLPFGKHTLGFSAVGASAPLQATDVKVEWSGEHVYNPGKAACFWLEAVAYGSASTDGLADGPLPLREFYSFKRVDNWFSENPPSISTKNSGETRVSLTSMDTCAEMTHEGCSVATRERFAACVVKAYASSDKDAYKACAREAGHACGAEASLP